MIDAFLNIRDMPKFLENVNGGKTAEMAARKSEEFRLSRVEHTKVQVRPLSANGRKKKKKKEPSRKVFLGRSRRPIPL